MRSFGQQMGQPQHDRPRVGWPLGQLPPRHLQGHLQRGLTETGHKPLEISQPCFKIRHLSFWKSAIFFLNFYSRNLAFSKSFILKIIISLIRSLEKNLTQIQSICFQVKLSY